MEQHDGCLSAYEVERLANIERNQEVLASLGLLDARLMPTRVATSTPRGPRERKVYPQSDRTMRDASSLKSPQRLSPGEPGRGFASAATYVVPAGTSSQGDLAPAPTAVQLQPTPVKSTRELKEARRAEAEAALAKELAKEPLDPSALLAAIRAAEATAVDLSAVVPARDALRAAVGTPAEHDELVTRLDAHMAAKGISGMRIPTLLLTSTTTFYVWRARGAYGTITQSLSARVDEAAAAYLAGVAVGIDAMLCTEPEATHPEGHPAADACTAEGAPGTTNASAALPRASSVRPGYVSTDATPNPTRKRPRPEDPVPASQRAQPPPIEKAHEASMVVAGQRVDLRPGMTVEVEQAEEGLLGSKYEARVIDLRRVRRRSNSEPTHEEPIMEALVEYDTLFDDPPPQLVAPPGAATDEEPATKPTLDLVVGAIVRAAHPKWGDEAWFLAEVRTLPRPSGTGSRSCTLRWLDEVGDEGSGVYGYEMRRPWDKEESIALTKVLSTDARMHPRVGPEGQKLWLTDEAVAAYDRSIAAAAVSIGGTASARQRKGTQKRDFAYSAGGRASPSAIKLREWVSTSSLTPPPEKPLRDWHTSLGVGDEAEMTFNGGFWHVVVQQRVAKGDSKSSKQARFVVRAVGYNIEHTVNARVLRPRAPNHLAC